MGKKYEWKSLGMNKIEISVIRAPSYTRSQGFLLFHMSYISTVRMSMSVYLRTQ